MNCLEVQEDLDIRGKWLCSGGQIFSTVPKTTPNGLLKVLDAEDSCKEDKESEDPSGGVWQAPGDMCLEFWIQIRCVIGVALPFLQQLVSGKIMFRRLKPVSRH